MQLMIRNLSVYIVFLVILNGCTQNVALLGPAISYSKTGNISQSALSFGTTHVAKKVKTKTNTESVKTAFDNNNNIKEMLALKNEETPFQKLVRNNIEETRKKLNLSNQ